MGEGKKKKLEELPLYGVGLEKKLKTPTWVKWTDRAIITTGYSSIAYFFTKAGIKLYKFAQMLNDQTLSKALESAGEVDNYDGMFDMFKTVINALPIELLYALGIGLAMAPAMKLTRSLYIKESSKFTKRKTKKRETPFDRLKKVHAKKGLGKAIAYPFERFFLEFANYGRLFVATNARAKRQKQIYEEIIKEDPDYLPAHTEKYFFHLNKKNYEETVFCIIDLLKFLNKRKQIFDPYQNSYRMSLENILLPFKRRDYLYRMDRMFSFLSLDDSRIDGINYLFKHQKTLMDGSEKSLLTSMVINDFVKQTEYVSEGWDKLVDKLWQVTINQIYSDKEIKQEVLSESGERVKILGPSNILTSTLIIKESKEKEKLEAEQQKTAELEEIVIDHHDLHTAGIINLSENQEKENYFMIIRREQGELLNNTTDIKAFEKAAQYLALIHNKLISIKGIRNYKQIIEQRIQTSEYEFLKPMIKEWGFLFDNLQGNYVFDKDAWGNNWVVNDNRITAIDLEDKGLNQQEFDLVKLINISGLSSENEEEKTRIFNKYVKSYGIKDKNSFMKAYLSAALPAIINFFIYSSEHGISKDTDRQRYLENARVSLQKLEDARARKLEKYIDKTVEVLG